MKAARRAAALDGGSQQRVGAVAGGDERWVMNVEQIGAEHDLEVRRMCDGEPHVALPERGKLGSAVDGLRDGNLSDHGLFEQFVASGGEGGEHSRLAAEVMRRRAVRDACTSGDIAQRYAAHSVLVDGALDRL